MKHVIEVAFVKAHLHDDNCHTPKVSTNRVSLCACAPLSNLPKFLLRFPKQLPDNKHMDNVKESAETTLFRSQNIRSSLGLHDKIPH